jgi:CspA family cold shock protein
MVGMVKLWHDDLGWGFAAVEGHKDVFVHYSQVQMAGHRSLEVGTMVEFELGEFGGRPSACNVWPVENVDMAAA